MRTDAERILAFRLRAQHLGRAHASVVEVAGGWALQDSPPGSAALALHARVGGLEAGALERLLLEERTLVALYNPRSAVSVVPARDVATFTAALAPQDDASRSAFMARVSTDHAITPADAERRAVREVAAALQGRTLSRDELHDELRARLPEAMLPFCPACGTHHARRAVLNAATVHGRLCLAGHEDRQPRFARPDAWLGATVDGADPDGAAAELARRYLRGFAPSTPRLLAEWAGVHRRHAERAWGAIADELAEVDVDGRPAWILGDDMRRLQRATAPSGVRLLPPGDPLLQARDRELLVADERRRRAIWGGTGSPGVVLVDGALAGTWRPRKQGTRLTITVTPFARLRAADRKALQAEAEAAAPQRGADEALVTFAA